MDNLDKKIRAFLIDEGYIFPVTDVEIEKSVNELENSHFEFPQWLDDKILKPMGKTYWVLTHKETGNILHQSIAETKYSCL